MNHIMRKFKYYIVGICMTLPVSGFAGCGIPSTLGVPVGDGLAKLMDIGIDFVTGGNSYYLSKAGLNSQTLSASLLAGPIGPIFVTLVASVIGQNIDQLEKKVFAQDNPEDAMRRAIKLGGTMIDSSINSVFKAAGIQVMVTVGTKMGAGLMSKIPYIGGALGGLIDAAGASMALVIGMFVAFVVLFIGGGVLLYFFLPLIPIIAFFSMVINWFLMIFINMLGAPVFCFNLIRSDGEGMIGRGEKYIADIIRTMITPAVLTIGMVAFVVLFNALFTLLTSMMGYFLPILGSIYSDSPYITMVTYTLVLVSFAVMVLYVAQTLATLCTAHAVRTVGHMIGEASHNIAENMPHQEMRSAVSGTSSQISGKTHEVSKIAGGGKGGGGGEG